MARKADNEILCLKGKISYGGKARKLINNIIKCRDENRGTNAAVLLP